jgi:pyruvate/2-oxoglutarate dehydrogenase complex dihydrolipoamide dehydrogenase (E3) component
VKVSLTAGGEKTVTAQSILIATGGRAVRAPIEGSVRVPSPAAYDQHPAD